VSSRRVCVGDVFTFPVGDEHLGVVQVVGIYAKDVLYFAVFEPVALPLLTGVPEDATTTQVLFLAPSLDALIHVGRWKYAANSPVQCGSLLPAYKETLGVGSHVNVVDFSGELRRPASEAEADRLTNRVVVAPIRIEKAVRAHCGLEPWHDAFDRLKPGATATTSEMFG